LSILTKSEHYNEHYLLIPRLAFSAATVQDIFNWLTVIVLLPLEVISGYLYVSLKKEKTQANHLLPIT